MNTQAESSSAAGYALGALMLFQGVSGLYGGAALVLDPTGRSLGLPLAYLEGTPFGDYLLPGLVLLFVLGLFPCLVFAGWLRGYAWATGASVLVGAALVAWILIQIALIGYQSRPPLQLIYGLAGAGILVLALGQKSPAGNSPRAKA